MSLSPAIPQALLQMQPSRGIRAKTDQAVSTTIAVKSHLQQPSSGALDNFRPCTAPLPPWWGFPPSLPRTVNTGSCTGTQ